MIRCAHKRADGNVCIPRQQICRGRHRVCTTTAASAGASAESLVRRLEEENRANNFLVTEKLPKEIEAKKKFVETLDKVTALAVVQMPIDLTRRI